MEHKLELFIEGLTFESAEALLDIFTEICELAGGTLVGMVTEEVVEDAKDD